MGIVMDMSNLQTEHDGMMEREYSEEVMYAGWVPAVSLQSATARKRAEIPADVAAVDVVFLQKFYSCMN